MRKTKVDNKPRKDRKINFEYVIDYEKTFDICATEEERWTLRNALYNAMQWGKKIDRENAEIKKRNAQMGILNKYI